MKIIQKFLSINKYSRPQTPLKKITKVVAHYVGNVGSTALENWNYFEDLKNGRTQIIKGKTVYKYASAHYIINLDGTILYTVPENEIAYTSNSANKYSIGIECCHPKEDGKFTDATYNALIELIADICKRYKLNPLTDVIRHYDVTKKPCPLWFVNHPEDWKTFKNKVLEKVNAYSIDTYTEAIDILVNKIGINKSYWNSKSNIDQYFDDFIVKVAKVINSMTIINNCKTSITFEQAIDILVAKIGLNKAYWIQKKSIDPYFEALMIKIAGVLKA